MIKQVVPTEGRSQRLHTHVLIHRIQPQFMEIKITCGSLQTIHVLCMHVLVTYKIPTPKCTFW